MLSVMSSPVVVGWYAVPTKLFTTLLFVPVIIATAWLPRLSAAFRESAATLRSVGKPALELVLVLSLPVAVGTALVAAPLIGDIYGAEFTPSVMVLVILALTLPPTYLNIMVNQLLVASNRQLSWTKVMVAAAIFNPILNLFLIRYFQSQQHNGAIGAALSLLVTEVVMAMVGLRLLPPVLDAKSALRVLKACVATLGMAAVVWAASRYGLLIETVAGVLTFGGLAFAMRLLSVEEFALLRAKVLRLR